MEKKMKPYRLYDSFKSKHSVSTLSLNLEKDTRASVLSPHESDFEELMSVKQIRSRRKMATPRMCSLRQLECNKTYLNMALSGRKYLAISKVKTEENVDDLGKAIDADRVNSKTRQAKLLSPIQFPPIRSELDAKSYLRNDFGFNMSRTDSFLGLQTPDMIKKRQELDEKIAAQAKKHIFACSNVGSVKKSCRANDSVVRLKQTMLANSNRQKSLTNGDFRLVHLHSNARSPEKFSTLHKPVGFISRSDLTSRNVRTKSNLTFPEITGFSLLN